MAGKSSQSLVLPTYAAPTRVQAAEQIVAELFRAKPPTREEQKLAAKARSQLVQIALTGGKIKIAERELVSLVTHTQREFQLGTAEMYALQASPKVSAEHESVTAQFSDICVLALNQFLQGAMGVGGNAIAEIMEQPIALEQKQGLLALLLGR